MRKIWGSAAAEFIDQRILAHRARFATFLSRFEARGTFQTWFEMYRAIEEFINLPAELDDDALLRRILYFRIDTAGLDLPGLAAIHAALTGRFEPGVVRRYVQMLTQVSSLGIAARKHGLPYADSYATIGEAAGYLQSRRRHFLALLYTIPRACLGSDVCAQTDALTVFAPMMELDAIPLTGLYMQRMLADVFPDYHLSVDRHGGFYSNHQYQTLNGLFLEAERVGVDEMYQERYDAQMAKDLEPTDPAQVFSTAELRNNVRIIENGFAEFDLAGTEFGAVAQTLQLLLQHCVDGFRVHMTITEFDRIVNLSGISAATRATLLHDGADFVDNTNQFAPFIRIEDECVSSVTLLTRYFNHLKSRCLDGVRRFQIHSGFVLEDTVKRKLTEQGFSVAGVKRIKRREFDVIATLDGIAYNVQCKNNHVDLTTLEGDPRQFARHVRRLARYYAKAISMEESREHLLKERLKVSEVRHVVVSRFPVATSDRRIISFVQLDLFRERFAAPSAGP